eukprot:CAMPEP_0178762496 /NCGR_PEP_ID=MMETSP0744-20121128/16569_1 /TAXON_ID=913974 /ORGANISM="Nitzschia punctata, Strain CCMP561" /LENGTH=183 /DNA_ID=CAMNT_0020417169 /DNA_START=6 /DNA_END=557 /DNA_ORIENTATION=-
MGPFAGTKEDRRGSGGIQGLNHLLMAERLSTLGLVEKYDRFIVARTDQYYTADLVLSLLDPSYIWVPKGEDYGGICDRFFIAGPEDILTALNTHLSAIQNPEKYLSFKGNIESFIKLRWKEDGILSKVRRFKRNMFSAAVPEDPTRTGKRKPAFEEDGIAIGFKYEKEYKAAMSRRNQTAHVN